MIHVLCWCQVTAHIHRDMLLKCFWLMRSHDFAFDSFLPVFYVFYFSFLLSFVVFLHGFILFFSFLAAFAAWWMLVSMMIPKGCEVNSNQPINQPTNCIIYIHAKIRVYFKWSMFRHYQMFNIHKLSQTSFPTDANCHLINSKSGRLLYQHHVQHNWMMADIMHATNN